MVLWSSWLNLAVLCWLGRVLPEVVCRSLDQVGCSRPVRKCKLLHSRFRSSVHTLLRQAIGRSTFRGVPVWDSLSIPSSDLRKAFLSRLHAFSGGIPRFVLFVLKAVLSCRPSLDSTAAISRAFEKGSPVVQSVMGETAFVDGAVGPIRKLVTEGDTKGMQTLVLGLLCVAAQVSLPGSSGFALASKFDALGLYLEGDQISKSVRVVMPDLMRLALQADDTADKLTQATVKELTISAGGASAGSIGDKMEGYSVSFFTVHLQLTWFFGVRLDAGTPQLKLLMEKLGLADRRFDFSERLVGVFGDVLGQVRVATPGTPKHYSVIVPKVFTLDTLQGKCVILKPGAHSASQDLFVSLPFTGGEHALLMVSCKATTSRPLSSKGQDGERTKAANVISALPVDVRALYGDNVFLVCFEYPSVRTTECSCETVRCSNSTGVEQVFKEVVLNKETMSTLITPGLFMPLAIQKAIEVRDSLCC